MCRDMTDSQQVARHSVEDHLHEARQRARNVLGGEGHFAGIDDWRRALMDARDAVIALWLVWVAFRGFGGSTIGPSFLVVLALGFALLQGVSAGRATFLQIRYHDAELRRERAEIHENIEHERDEVRALYAAKGFDGTVLEQIVDVISEDDDRLLKVMMEEELGLSIQHMDHPLVVGARHFAACALAGLVLTVPSCWWDRTGALPWMPVVGGFLLAGIGVVVTGGFKKAFLEFLVAGVLMAITTGAVVFFLSQWMGSLLSDGGAREAALLP